MSTDRESREPATAGPAVRVDGASQLEALRHHLPGLEPDRHVTDWGRSERVEAVLDRTLYEFLYHYWFRVAVEGIEHVPSRGPVLIVANQAGAAAPSAAMIAKAIRQEHAHPRPLHVITSPHLSDWPAIGMLVTKLGGVANHRANLHRLLFDEGQLVLGFPESANGAKPIKERYRLRQFDDAGLIETALGAGATIVPTAVIGAEEALPVIARLGLPARLTRLPAIRLGAPMALPAKFKLRFLEPVQADAAAAPGLAHEIRALLQENLLEMLAQRRSVWLG